MSDRNDVRLSSNLDLRQALVAIDDLQVLFDFQDFSDRSLHNQTIEPGIGDDVRAEAEK